MPGLVRFCGMPGGWRQYLCFDRDSCSTVWLRFWWHPCLAKASVVRHGLPRPEFAPVVSSPVRLGVLCHEFAPVVSSAVCHGFRGMPPGPWGVRGPPRLPRPYAAREDALSSLRSGASLHPPAADMARSSGGPVCSTSELRCDRLSGNAERAF